MHYYRRKKLVVVIFFYESIRIKKYKVVPKGKETEFIF
ncbi:hypothetical protein BN424_1365 [Carnobacterium maltaromaticum LMA28]|uniref:Uncharacterized protein n=1 Tax=Carnobacterium maltaromaticum LMA28 TaxID=1234679 RepID=K8E3F0_CARML|nr:hypothetical protein BN424_1365 [Carnobacterium maltaromaticum LMA28]